MIYGFWDLNCNRQIFFVIFSHFLPFYAPNRPENENIKKLKKAPGDIIILRKCTKNHDHRLYYSWYMVCAGRNCYFSFLEISSYYTSVLKMMIIGYTVSEIWHRTDVIVIFHFGLYFALLPPLKPENWKNRNIEKNTWRYHHFTQVYQKSWSQAILFLRYGVRRM